MSNTTEQQQERLPFLAKRNDVMGVSKCLEEDTPSLIEQRDAMLMGAKFGHLEIITCLISNGISVNIASDKGTTPLMQAAHRGHDDCCKLLLNSNANVDEQNEKKKTSLMLAVLCGHVHIVETLLKYGRANSEVTEASGRTALYLASSIGNVDIVKTLLKYNSNRNAETNTKLTPLMAAARGGYDEILNLFLEIDQDCINRKDGDDINNDNNDNYIKDIDLQDQYGRTALIIAASVGKTSTCKLLLKHGANINSQSDNGTTALMAAIDGKAEIECIEFLIGDENSIVSLCNIQGASALSFAAKRGYHNICKRLLDKDVDVESANERGTTALMVAANNGHLSVCKLLLEHGADPLRRNIDRANAVDCAATSVVGACLISWIEDLNDDEEDDDENGDDDDEHVVDEGKKDSSEDDQNYTNERNVNNGYEEGSKEVDYNVTEQKEEHHHHHDDITENNMDNSKKGSPTNVEFETQEKENDSDENENDEIDDEERLAILNDLDSKLKEFYEVCERSNGPPRKPDKQQKQQQQHNNKKKQKDEKVNKFKNKELQAFVCPITQEVMVDPCTCMDGHTYERKAIERWLENHDTSPLTGAKLPSKMLLTNFALRNAIEESQSSATSSELKK